MPQRLLDMALEAFLGMTERERETSDTLYTWALASCEFAQLAHVPVCCPRMSRCRAVTVTAALCFRAQELVQQAVSLFERAERAPGPARPGVPSPGACLGGRAYAELLQVCV